MRPSTLREKVNLQYCFDRSDYSVTPGGSVVANVSIQEIANTQQDLPDGAAGTVAFVDFGPRGIVRRWCRLMCCHRWRAHFVDQERRTVQAPPKT